VNFRGIVSFTPGTCIKSKLILLIDTHTGATRRLHIPEMEESGMSGGMLRRFTGNQAASTTVRMCPDLSEDFCSVLFFEREG